MKKKPEDVDTYISLFTSGVQEKLQEVRAAVRQAVPDALETIKYDMPAYVLNGNLVFFAAYKNHIGFFGVPSGDEKLVKELQSFKQGRGSVQFPLDKPLPVKLISKMVKQRAKENKQKLKEKSKK